MNATINRLRRLAADPSATDGALLEAFLAGDQSAFALLVHRHAGLVFATCRRVLRHQQDAEDAFQAAFLVLARRAGDVWPRDAVGVWLFGVAHRVALKARTTRARRAGREQPLEDVTSAEPPGTDFDAVEVVHRVVAKLPEMYRAAVVACDFQGLSRKDAAARLGWTEGTLSGRLARARLLLAIRLRRLGLSAPVGGVALVVPEVVSAALVRSACVLVTGGAVPVPVLALTEGAVRSMALFKIKAMAAVVFTACALGFGAFAASGSGTGRDGQQQSQTQGATGGGAAFTPAAALAPPKPVAALDPLQGKWVVRSIAEDGRVARRDSAKEWSEWVVTVRGATLLMPYQVASETNARHREYKISADGSKRPKTIDMIDGSNPVARGIYEFTGPATACVACHAVGDRYKVPGQDWLAFCEPALKQIAEGKIFTVGLRLALSIDGKRPAKFGGEGVVVFETVRRADDLDAARERLEAQRRRVIALAEKEKLETELKAIQERLDELAARSPQRQAELDLRDAQKQVDLARAQVDKAQQMVLIVNNDLEQARVALSLAEKKLADLKKPKLDLVPQNDTVFTVHIRTLTAAEKVIRVKIAGNQTVLEGLVYAADDVPLKTEGVSVWVVRDEKMLAVDLSGITKNGDTKTNYVLKPGDQLFVQTKPIK